MNLISSYIDKGYRIDDNYRYVYVNINAHNFKELYVAKLIYTSSGKIYHILKHDGLTIFKESALHVLKTRSVNIMPSNWKEYNSSALEEELACLNMRMTYS